jgi:7,8-dihydropterin-6-yl-methyl-4-(beta-D-ribofuranosyl)aminobenzene 5'-phosphate synthase
MRIALFLVALNLYCQPARIQVLSTMLADARGYGEWGFAALVEVNGKRILFDTGAHPETVLNNVRAMNIDLSDVTDVILSHNHLDHTAGLVTLRREFAKKNPKSLSVAHAAQGIFLDRQGGSMPQIKKDYEAMGGRFVVYDKPVELMKGVWLTGPVPRVFPEKNWSGGGDDTIPEDQSLVIEAPQGLIVLAGCGHAGIINTLDYARKKIRNAPIYAAIGGFHLFAATDENLQWTGDKLREFGLQNLLGAHCTGIEAVYRLRTITGLNRSTASVAAVGAVFEAGKPTNPGAIAK